MVSFLNHFATFGCVPYLSSLRLNVQQNTPVPHVPFYSMVLASNLGWELQVTISDAPCISLWTVRNYLPPSEITYHTPIIDTITHAIILK